MKTASQLRLGLGLMASILSCVFIMSSSSRHTPAFASFPVATRQISSSFSGARFVQVHHRAPASSRGNMKSELNMFMGSDGGVLGIGTPELVRSYYIHIDYIHLYLYLLSSIISFLFRLSRPHLISFVSFSLLLTLNYGPYCTGTCCTVLTL